MRDVADGQRNVDGLERGLAESKSFEEKLGGVIKALEVQDKLNKKTQTKFEANQQQISRQLADVQKAVAKADTNSQKSGDLSKRVHERAIKVEAQMDKIEDMSDALSHKLDEETDLAIGTESHREELEEMQDTMDKTLEAVTALSSGVEKQQQSMEVRRKKIEARDAEVAAHQRKIEHADEQLTAHVALINQATKDNKHQQIQIERNIATIKKHQKKIKELAEKQGTQTKTIAQQGLTSANNKNDYLLSTLKDNKYQATKLNKTFTSQNDTIHQAKAQAGRLENAQVLLSAEVGHQKENITEEEKNLTETEAGVKKLEEDDEKLNAAAMNILYAIGAVFAVILLYTCVKLRRMKKVFEEPQPATDEAAPEDEGQDLFPSDE